MTSRRELDNMILRNRNAVLYILRIAGYPLEYPEIMSVMNESGMIRGFDLDDSIRALLETKCVVVFNDEYGDEKYMITSSGKNVCDDMLAGVLDNADKRNLLDCVLKILSFERRGGKIEYSVEKAKDDNKKPVFKCRIFDGVEDILKLELAVDSEYYVNLAAKNFDKRPESVYRSILSLLTRES